MTPPPGLDTLDFLLAQICHLHHSRIHQLLESLGLYRGQPPLLHALWEQQGQTHTELAARLNVTPATITKMLQRMEKAGFILRKPDPTDQRVSRVFLTEAGLTVQTGVQAVLDQMEAETFASFTPHELVQLRRFLQQIRENLLASAGERLPF